jgi:peptidoglycan/xylan/chitin deacetylase (PgdA/CDA1 family)
MRLVSPLLKRVVYPALAGCGYFRHAAPPGVAMVTYHGIFPSGYRSIDPILDGNLVTASTFRAQLALLKRQYTLIRPEEFLLWLQGKQKLPPRSVLLTCDDGLKNTLTEMLPILEELELSCLFFITGSSLAEGSEMLWYERLYLMFLSAGESIRLEIEEIALRHSANGRQEKHSLWWKLAREFSAFDALHRSRLLDQVRSQLGLTEGWDAGFRRDPAQCSRFFLLNAAELHRLADSGMCIGAHSLSHPVLSMSGEALAWKEISESRSGLEQALTRKVWALAYPFGDPTSITAREFAMAARAGFDCAFANVGGGFGAAMPSFALPRVHVTADMNLGEFEAHVSGFYRRLRKQLAPEDGLSGSSPQG